jgi:hypothetical protein
VQEEAALVGHRLRSGSGGCAAASAESPFSGRVMSASARNFGQAAAGPLAK